MAKDIFNTTDIYYRKVKLEEQTLNNHILGESGHEEIRSDPDCIRKTIEDPDYIYCSATNPQREVYFGKGKHVDEPVRFVKVIVSFFKPDKGVVTSAWIQDEVKGGIGDKKYEKS
jgi:hypothetical protein